MVETSENLSTLYVLLVHPELQSQGISFILFSPIGKKKTQFLKKINLRAHVLSVGPLIPLFWNFGENCSFACPWSMSIADLYFGSIQSLFILEEFCSYFN